MDANIGTTIAGALTAIGHDVARALASTPDTAVLALAAASQRILITCDRDFGDLVFFRRLRAPLAVIYIRFEPEDVKDIVPRLLAILDPEALAHHMTVIDDAGVRRRPLPAAESNDNA